MDGLTANETAAICQAALESHFILQSIDLGTTFGVGFIGVAISAMAYGVTCCQTFYYYRSSKAQTDPWTVKLLVAALVVLDTLHEIFIIHILYYYLVINYAQPIALSRNIWSLSLQVIMNSIIAFLCEGFLVYRLWRLGRNPYVTGACLLMITAHAAMNLVYPIRGWVLYPNVEVALVKLRAIGSGGLAVAVITDVSISAALTFYLQKSRTGFRKSDSVITKLILLTITTGTLTTCFVIADLVAYLVSPSSLFVAFFNFLLSKLYINSLLTSLNVRDLIRAPSAESTTRGVNSIPLGALRGSNHPSDPLSVTVTQEAIYDAESLRLAHDMDNGKKTLALEL